MLSVGAALHRLERIKTTTPAHRNTKGAKLQRCTWPMQQTIMEARGSKCLRFGRGCSHGTRSSPASAGAPQLQEFSAISLNTESSLHAPRSHPAQPSGCPPPPAGIPLCTCINRHGGGGGMRCPHRASSNSGLTPMKLEPSVLTTPCQENMRVIKWGDSSRRPGGKGRLLRRLGG